MGLVIGRMVIYGARLGGRRVPASAVAWVRCRPGDKTTWPRFRNSALPCWVQQEISDSDSNYVLCFSLAAARAYGRIPAFSVGRRLYLGFQDTVRLINPIGYVQLAAGFYRADDAET